MHFGKNMRTYYLILIPILVLFFAFNTFPLINGLIYSFTNSKGYGGFDWVGFRNYADLFTDTRVGNSYLFTFKMAVVGTIVINQPEKRNAMSVAMWGGILRRSFRNWLKTQPIGRFAIQINGLQR